MVGRWLPCSVLIALTVSAAAGEQPGSVFVSFTTWRSDEPDTPKPDAPKDEKAEPGVKDETEDSAKSADRASKPAKPDQKPVATAPGQVIASVVRASNAAKCDVCRGDGKATEERTGGSRESIPGVRTPTKQQVEVKCKKCEGTGLSHAPRLVNEMKDFARQLGKVNDNDERWPAATEKVLQTLRDLTKFGAKAWQGINNNKLRTMINQNKDPIGESIFFVGRVDSDIVEAAPEGGMALRSMSIRMPGNRLRSAVFERPLVVDAEVDQVVLVGGVIARRAAEGGDFVLYIDRGYVVRFDGPANDLKEGR